ncbi:hypothetical protein LJR289_004639 [Pseudoduganella sp. LjRoot289]|uniref:hypothetical protein n=1 Tax=Pseudoduganella sp. LjRoot289 TaxID=3342314 RepID=UPI003ECCC7D9
MRKILLATLPLLLTACVNDSATYYADGTNNHTLSLRRQQDYFWTDNVRLTLLAARLPECQRQIPLGEAPRDDVEMELFSSGENRWSLRSGEQVWQVETQGCSLVSETGPAAGEKVGVFKVEGDKLLFEPAVAAAAPAAAPAAPAPAPAN